MKPVWMPDRCLLSLAGAGGECRIHAAGWRPRRTGPRYPLRIVRCRVHGQAFTLYPVGHVPYGREPVVCQTEQGDEDLRSSLVGAAVAASRGERWPEDLIEGEAGPVGRTQRRRIVAVGRLVGLDRPLVDSRVLGELGLDAVQVQGSLTSRVARLGRLGPGLGPWLRVVGAIDLVGRLGSVGVMPGVARSRLTPARGARARFLRGPPSQGWGGHESVLARGAEGP
jgi:hypothetical protein